MKPEENNKQEELKDEQLDNVAGGICIRKSLTENEPLLNSIVTH